MPNLRLTITTLWWPRASFGSGALIMWQLAAENWTRFRGPNGTGVSNATNLPVEFGPTSHVKWKAALPPGSLVAGLHQHAHLPDRALAGEGRLQAVRARARSQDAASSCGSTRSSAATEGPARARQRPRVAEPGHRRHQRLFLLPGIRADQLHRRRQGALAHAARALQHVLRLRRVADPRRRHVLLAGRSGHRPVSARGRRARPARSAGACTRPHVISGYSTPTIWRPKTGSPAQILIPESFQLTVVFDRRRQASCGGCAASRAK